MSNKYYHIEIGKTYSSFDYMTVLAFTTGDNYQNEGVEYLSLNFDSPINDSQEHTLEISFVLFFDIERYSQEVVAALTEGKKTNASCVVFDGEIIDNKKKLRLNSTFRSKKGQEHEFSVRLGVKEPGTLCIEGYDYFIRLKE